jgi:hypothetical protein
MKKIIFSLVVLAFILSGCHSPAEHISMVKSVPVHQQNDFYTGNRKPLKPLHFIKLPVGNIKPRGWLLECLKRMRDGETGHLAQISAWLQKKNNAWLNKGNKYGWEEVPYWLRGYSNLGYVLDDQQIINKAKAWLLAVIKGQRKDGWFGPPNKRKDGTRSLWPNMIMLSCLRTYYSYSHDPRVIKVMTNYFKWELNVPDNQFLTGYWGKARASDNLYNVYWLYNRTGDKWLLKLGDKIHRNGDKWEQLNTLPTWHNVNIAEGFKGPAIFEMQSHDSTDLDATYRDFRMVRNRYGQVPGGMFGADENARPGHAGAHQAIETCGVVEQMGSDEKLLRITGNPLWAANAENVAFNTFPATELANFKGIRYLTAPNMVASDAKNHSPGIQNSGPMFCMNPLSHRCCQHNHGWGWPFYAENLVAATPDNGLAALLYSSSVTMAKVGNGTKIELHEHTHYPFSTNIKFTISTSKNVKFPLYLLVPSWEHQQLKVKINGKAVSLSPQKGSYIRIDRMWSDGDQVQLTLPMKLSVKRWHKNRNSASVRYGPLTFSLKIKEKYKKLNPKKTALPDSKWQKDVNVKKWPAYAIFPKSPWNYGLVLNKEKPAASFTVEHRPWPDNNFPFTLDNVPIQIKATGKRIPGWGIGRYGLVENVPMSPVTTKQPKHSITLVPMGAARIRISVFPVVR